VVVLDAREALFLGGRDQHAVRHQRAAAES
jgi:hypothetical protein